MAGTDTTLNSCFVVNCQGQMSEVMSLLVQPGGKVQQVSSGADCEGSEGAMDGLGVHVTLSLLLPLLGPLTQAAITCFLLCPVISLLTFHAVQLKPEL